MDEKVKKLTDRFEIAVENFGRSCFNMKANEKCFQAWFASSVIQEFGLARVYREIHLAQPLLAKALSGDDKQLFNKNMISRYDLFPDLSISYDPDVNVRHTQTREDSLKDPLNILHKFAIISEFKVTGSTRNRTSISLIEQDLKKLLLFNKVYYSGENKQMLLATYFILLDNYLIKNRNYSVINYINIIREKLESVKDMRYIIKIIYLGSDIPLDIKSSEDFIIKNLR